MTSSDIWFRPAQFANAPDGSLHVIDVCREVIEHPKSLPPDIKRHLDLTAGRDRGRIYRIVPRGFQHRKTPHLADFSTAELVKTLEHTNAWHRETAARLLYQRQDKSAVPALRKLASESDSPLGRMHALYAIDGLGELDAPLITERLDDADPNVRRHAVRLAEKLSGNIELSRALARRADDASLEVRYQLAFTIGSDNNADRLSVLEKLIRRDPDDVWIQTAVQSSLADGAGHLFAALLNDAGFRSEAAAGFLRKLAAQIGQQNQAADIKLALATLPALPESDAPFALPILGELLKGRHRGDNILSRLSKSGELQAVDAVATKMSRASIATAVDESADADKRMFAIDALSFGSFEQVEPALVSLLDNRQPNGIQRAAITTLGNFSSPRIARPLLQAWPGLSPQLRETASEVLFARADRTIALFDSIDAGDLSVADIAKTRLLVAAKSRNATIKSRAEKYLNAAGSRLRKDVVDAYADALDLAGDPDRGRTLFRKHCAGLS